MAYPAFGIPTFRNVLQPICIQLIDSTVLGRNSSVNTGMKFSVQYFINFVQHKTGKVNINLNCKMLHL